MTLAAIDWTAVREWMAALGTSGALIIAAVTLGFEFRARRRLEDRLDRERRLLEEAQARRVTVVGVPAIVGNGAGRRPTLDVHFEVENESDQAVLDVMAAALVSVPDHAPVGVVAEDWCRKLSPGGRYTSEFRGKAGRPEDLEVPAMSTEIEFDSRDDPVDDRWITIAVQFTDAAGQRWETNGRGTLHRIEPVSEDPRG